jgi:putative Holliday junction resolvase
VRPGVRLGIDVGSVRVGLALSDPRGILATPLETVGRDQRTDSDLDRIADVISEHDVLEVVVGLPATLAGREGIAARVVRTYASELARRVHPVPVRAVDERLTTVAAHSRLAEAGRRSRERRQVVDQAAAVEILQGALDAERSSGRPPGTLVLPGPLPEGPGQGDHPREAGPR